MMYPLIFAMLMFSLSVSAFGQESCGAKSLCKEMTSCAEAKYFFEQCGVGRLDADDDGIPCESICGQSDTSMRARSEAQPFASPADDGAPLGLKLQHAPAKSVAEDFRCGAKRTCKQMTTCEEATYYLNTCGVRSLDDNKDGIACNGLCR